MEEESAKTWTNWSGSLRFEPDRIVRPESEAEVCSLVRRCADEGRTVRVVGEGHSSSPVVETDDVLVSLEELSGVVSHDDEAKRATIRGGTTLQEACAEFQERRLAFPNLGDVSLQMVAGAFATGTHGSGTAFGNLASRLVGGRLVTGEGEVREFDAESDPELLRAARVSLGALGILTELTIDLVPAYKLERREYCTTYGDCRDHLETLAAENRNFDFYWYPRSDEVKLRLMNAPDGGTDESDLSYASLVERSTGWWHQAIPEHNQMTRKFDEMEYAVPRADGLECFRRVRDRVRDRWRADVGWRVLWRTVAADDGMLSPPHDRDTVTVSLLQNAQLDHEAYFEDMEPLFQPFDGRPHWGKEHSLRAPELAERYPEWERFRSIRADLDPEGVFLNDYLRDLFGVDGENRRDGGVAQ